MLCLAFAFWKFAIHRIDPSEINQVDTLFHVLTTITIAISIVAAKLDPLQMKTTLTL